MHSTTGTVVGTRSNNQDALLVHGKTALVVDGMGGHANGREWAESIKAHAESWLKEHGDPVNLPGMAKFHWHVLENSREDAKQFFPVNVGGACYAMVTLHEDKALVNWIGDCRVGRLRNNKFEWLTTDHNYIEGWRARPDEAPRDFEDRLGHLHGIITRAVCVREGQEGSNTFVSETRSFDARPGDVYLVCSDGVYGTLTDGYIAAGLKANTSAQALVEAAEASNKMLKGRSDNCTAVIVR